MGTADSGEMAPETPQPTHIDVHIHQESALAKLLLTCCSALRPPATQARGSSRLLVASWVMQIVLGILSGVLGGFLYMRRFTLLVSSGAAIWTGAVAVLAGVTAFIYETRGGTYWSLLRSLLELAAFSTAIAALELWNEDLRYGYYYGDSLCRISTFSNWYNTPAPTDSPEEVRRLQLCTSLLDMLKALFITLQAMLLAVWILLLLASLAPLGLYCWRIFSAIKWWPSPESPCPQPSGLQAKEPSNPGKSISVLCLCIRKETRRRCWNEWNLAMRLLIIAPGAPALGIPASDCWKKNPTGEKRLSNSPSYPAPRTTATALLQQRLPIPCTPSPILLRFMPPPKQSCDNKLSRYHAQVLA
ncbi:transmembrane protein 176A isoform X2 [Sapajus apella]|nr:transmembrane protein 176A isoform X2 [Sapajus apella]